MSSLGSYFTKISKKENAIEYKNVTNEEITIKRKKIDIEQLWKFILTWLLGGSVSLLPTFMYLWIKPSEGNLLINFFSNKDLFLVITTLTISVILEMFFDSKTRVLKYIITSIGLFLIIFSIYMFTILQFEIGFRQTNHVFRIGLGVLAACIIISSMGYIMISCERGCR